MVLIDRPLTPLLLKVFNNLLGLVNEPIDAANELSIESMISFL